MSDETEPPITITIAPAYGVHDDLETDAVHFSRFTDYLDELLEARGWHRVRERATWARVGLALGE